jgi:hypothetical protein
MTNASGQRAKRLAPLRLTAGPRPDRSHRPGKRPEANGMPDAGESEHPASGAPHGHGGEQAHAGIDTSGRLISRVSFLAIYTPESVPEKALRHG